MRNIYAPFSKRQFILILIIEVLLGQYTNLSDSNHIVIKIRPDWNVLDEEEMNLIDDNTYIDIV